MWVNLGEDINLLVLHVQQDLHVLHLRFEQADALFQGFGVSSGKRSPAQLVAGFALKPDIGALRAAGADAVTADLLASASITRLSDPALRAGPELNYFHR